MPNKETTPSAKVSLNLWRPLLLLLFGWILYAAGREFYDIGLGTGNWYGEFSPKWLSAFMGFILFALAALILTAGAIFRPRQLKPIIKTLILIRERLGIARWLLAAIILLLPLVALQYTDWGVVISGFYLRILIWGIATALATILVTRGKKSLATWPTLLATLIISAAILSVGAALTNVTDYPFSLGWSEGNRLYDYSLLFGEARYLYTGQIPRPALDIGRQFLGGLPFIFPQLSILGARFWLAILGVIPYLLFGWFAFGISTEKRDLQLSAFAALWGFLFVKQGPIHPPLLLCAILVALAWRRPLWLSIPVLAWAGYFAQVSRSTWMFAPAMWIAMLEFSSAAFKSNKASRETWIRTIVLAGAGLFGGFLLPIFRRWLASSPDIVNIPWTDQPLLWYRLLPNATYGPGILLGLLLASGPLIFILIYWIVSRKWKLNSLQLLLLAASLAAFLIVGLIVSTKIGGGADLHNLDMFILGLAFTAAIAWRNGGSRWVGSSAAFPVWLQLNLVLLLLIPAVRPLMSLRPLEAADEAWLLAIMDVNNRRWLALLPPEETVEDSLSIIRSEVDLADANGEVLFMDQRQLLTFGYIRGVPLISEYEKKKLMNEALSADAAFFAPFYQDLRAGRFELIVIEPLFTPIKDEDYVFGEENNAWVTWVSKPVLCYYEPIEWLVAVRVQLLVPRAGQPDCSNSLPVQ